MLADLARDLAAEARASVVHGDDDAEDVELRIQVLLHERDGVEQLGEPFERVVLGLHRDEDLPRGDQRVDREHAQRRRAVDEDEVVAVDVAGERVLEHVLVARASGELHDGAGQVRAGRQQREMLDGASARWPRVTPGGPTQHPVAA